MLLALVAPVLSGAWKLEQALNSIMLIIENDLNILLFIIICIFHIGVSNIILVLFMMLGTRQWLAVKRMSVANRQVLCAMIYQNSLISCMPTSDSVAVFPGTNRSEHINGISHGVAAMPYGSVNDTLFAHPKEWVASTF